MVGTVSVSADSGSLPVLAIVSIGLLMIPLLMLPCLSETVCRTLPEAVPHR